MEKISIREFARRIGTDHKTVTRAIAKGRITKGYVKSTKKIIFEKAFDEWGKTYQERKAAAEQETVSTDNMEDISAIRVMDITLGVDDSLIIIEKKHALIKAYRDLLKAKTESGELQNKEEVYREFFAIGKEIRTSLQSIPDRIIDRLVTLDRTEAHKLLSEEINTALVKLTGDVN